MDKKSAILQFITQNPGVMSVDIAVGLSRASVGAHAKALLNQGLLIRDMAGGWHISHGYVVAVEPKGITPIDITGECIRKMIDVK
jgi:predicted DNA-binding transcriptional regulator